MISTEFRIPHNIIDYKGHRVPFYVRIANLWKYQLITRPPSIMLEYLPKMLWEISKNSPIMLRCLPIMLDYVNIVNVYNYSCELCSYLCSINYVSYVYSYYVA